MKAGMPGNQPVEREGQGSRESLRRIRWRLRRGWASLRYGKSALESSPVLFGNSFPKSGTHLLAQVLQAFPQIGLAVDRGMGPILTFVRFTGRRRSPREILDDLNALRPGDMCFGHIIASPEIQGGWQRDKVAHYFMLRDPRDVVVSHAYYIADKAIHNVHHEYYQSLPTLADRIRASILGRPDWEGDFPNIRDRFELYMGWLDCSEVCTLRFEDFISNRRASLGVMLDYAREMNFQINLDDQEAIDRLAIAIDPQRSFTFRSGKIGEWRTHFSPEHSRMFKEIAGDLLIRLGYEQDQDW